MNPVKSISSLPSSEAFPPIEKREQMRSFPHLPAAGQGPPLFYADSSDFASGKGQQTGGLEQFTGQMNRGHKQYETTTRFSSSKESSQLSSKREAPTARETVQREKFLEKLYSGVLPHRQYLPLTGTSLPKLKAKKEKRKVVSQVASLLLPFPDGKLPKTYRAALAHTRTRKCVIHKLAAYDYVDPRGGTDG